MLHLPKWVLMALLVMMSACYPGWNRLLTGGGGMPQLTLPFASGEYWLLTQGYGDQNIFGSHEDWGSRYYDDSYALDFSQPGCEPYGKPVFPVAPGTVLDVSTSSSYGETVLIDHDNGYVSRYAHLSDIFVQEGDRLSTRDSLGAVGNTGNVVGQACPKHPGTHLHLALYRDGNGIPPLPLSDQSSMHLGCWYNREGGKNCRANQPPDYSPEDWDEEAEEADEDEDDEDEDDRDYDDEDMSIEMLRVTPERGVVSSTRFVWTTVIEGDEPEEVILMIYNENDDQTYEFDMDSHSNQSPWVYSYRKTLRDTTTYTYWVEVEDSQGDRIESDEEEVDVEEAPYNFLTYEYFISSPDYGDVGDSFDWEVLFEAQDEPEMELMILNPNDGEIYSFDMDVDDFGRNAYTGSYSKTLRDATTYVYWVMATVEDTVTNSEVFVVETD